MAPHTTSLMLHNTLTRHKSAFVPDDAENVRMYVCGPTVYDYAHIGNARPVIVFDVLFRVLRHIYGESHVTYVRNITDVDDKINARALRDYPNLPLNEAIAQVTEKTATQFHADVAALGCLPPTFEPRATQHIDAMVSMIQTLLDKQHAYIAAGAQGREVLFRVGSMPAYGQLSNRKLEDQQAGARVAVEAHKQNPGDFVLWKESAADEPGWSGTFNGETIHGRPGWHIECSVMSRHHLGETFDIHGGGLDLIFPHHENEIAQSCCAHGTDKMANVWMHNGYLQVEGKKMSKSDGNFITIHDLLHTDKFGGRKWPGEVLRLAMLMTHYREPIDFSVRRLEEAEKMLFKWADFLDTILRKEIGTEFTEVIFPQEWGVLDDLNLWPVISQLSEQGKMGASGNIAAASSFRLTLQTLGFDDLEMYSATSANFGVLIDEGNFDIDDKIAKRLACIADKDFAEADRIRDELLAQGIQLKDGKDADGNRVTTWEMKR